MSNSNVKLSSILGDKTQMQPIIDDSTEPAPSCATVCTKSEFETNPPVSAPKTASSLVEPPLSPTQRIVNTMKDAMHTIGEQAIAIKDAVLGYHPESSTTSKAKEVPPMQHVLHSESEPVHSVRPLKPDELPDETHMSHSPTFAKKAQRALDVVGHKIVEAKNSLVDSIHAATHHMPGDQPIINEQDDQFHLAIAKDKARGPVKHDIEVVAPDGSHTIIDETGQTRVIPSAAIKSDESDTFMPAKDNTSVRVGSKRPLNDKETLSTRAHETATHLADVASQQFQTASKKMSETAKHVGDVISQKTSEWSHEATAKARVMGQNMSAATQQGIEDLKAQAKIAVNDASVKSHAFASMASQKTKDLAETTKSKFAEVTKSNLKSPPNDLDRSPIQHVRHSPDEPIRSIGPIDPDKLPDETNLDHSGSISHQIQHGAKLLGRKVNNATDQIAKAFEPSHHSHPATVEKSDERFHSQMQHDILAAAKQPKDVPFELVLDKSVHLPIRDEFTPIEQRIPLQPMKHPSMYAQQAKPDLLEEKTQETTTN